MIGTKEYHHEYGMKVGHAPIAEKVVCVDFDGTLFPWGPLFNLNAKPEPGAVDALWAFRKAGWTIAIFTSRMSPRWLDHAGEREVDHRLYVSSLCGKNNIPFDFITGEKIPAQAYIDDKAIEYDGTNWDTIKERVLGL